MIRARPLIAPVCIAIALFAGTEVVSCPEAIMILKLPPGKTVILWDNKNNFKTTHGSPIHSVPSIAPMTTLQYFPSGMSVLNEPSMVELAALMIT